MAIAAALLTAAGDATDLSTYTTASIAPTANRLVLLAVTSRGAGAEEIPVPTGNGLTYVEVLSVASGTAIRCTVFRAMGASPSAGAVSIPFGSAQTACVWSIVEYDGIDTGGTNGSAAVVQSIGGSGIGTAGNADFTNPFGDAVNNGTYSAIAHANAADTIVEATFTEMSDTNTESALALQVMWKIGEDQTPAPTWAGSVDFAQVAIELKALTSQTLTGVLFSKAPTFPTGAVSHVVIPPPPTPSTGGNRMGGTGAIRKPPRNR